MAEIEVWLLFVKILEFPRELKPKYEQVEEYHVNKLIAQLRTLFQMIEDPLTSGENRADKISKTIKLYETIDRTRWRDMTFGCPERLVTVLREGAMLGIPGMRSTSVDLYPKDATSWCVAEERSSNSKPRSCCAAGNDDGCQIM